MRLEMEAHSYETGGWGVAGVEEVASALKVKEVPTLVELSVVLIRYRTYSTRGADHS